jgi:type IV pilus assembly protein PilW
MTLLELMVALAVGSLLIIGTFSVYLQSRATFRVNESIARLQENARYVFDVMAPDIRMAGYWGPLMAPFTITGSAGPHDAISPLAPASDCGPNWSVDLDAPIAGSNDSYDFDCAAYGRAAAAADTLVVRRADATASSGLAAGTLYLRVTPDQDAALLKAGAGVPLPAPGSDTETHALIVNGYYVSHNSTLDSPGNSVPSLRRKLLRGRRAEVTLVDEEVLPGIEDLQIRFGIDTDIDGAVDRYVNADDAVLDPDDERYDPAARILSVRVWLRLRSEHREAGMPPGTGYSYAGRVIAPFNDGFRRLVVSTTIFIRNARRAS